MKSASPAYTLVFIGIICFVFALGVSSVHQATRDMLARNETLHRNRILCQAFDLDVSQPTAKGYQHAVTALGHETLAVPGEKRSFEVYRHFSPSGETVGFIFSAIGFWDRISGILVLSPNLKSIRAIRFLSHKETPGLGARIDENTFTAQFENLAIDWNAPGGQHIVIGPYSSSRLSNRVDAISGASQTSMALMKSLNTQLELFRKAYTRSHE